VKTARDSDKPVLGWTRGDRHFALAAGAIIFILLLGYWGRMTWRAAPAVEIQRLEAEANRFQLEINSATWVEWMQLEGVGEALSRRIVDDREQNGPFESVDDVQRVRGIGPATIETLRPWLRCADCPPPSATNDRNET
jgi:competence protein ComEA